MCEVKLKHYKRYIKSLEQFALCLGQRIVYKGDEQGVFMPYKNEIRIDPEMSESEEVATILHELGHVVDYLFRDYDYATEMAYRRVYKHKISKNQNNLVVRAEKLAWRLGRVIAGILGIKLGKWYDRCEKESVEGYKKS